MYLRIGTGLLVQQNVQNLTIHVSGFFLFLLIFYKKNKLTEEYGLC